MLGACQTEKSPPLVSWIQPSSPPVVAEGQALLLRFRVEDPAPIKGSTDVGDWRVNIGPSSGGTWWTSSGALSSAPGPENGVDTIEINWTVGSSPGGGTEAVELLFSAVGTDGEGQVGADFISGMWAPVALESSGLWWPGGNPGSAFSLAAGPNASQVLEHPGASIGSHLVHLDGADVLVTGSDDLQGWSLAEGVPSGSPIWTIPAPLSAGEGGLRHLRRAPDGWTSSAWFQSGWADRCTWRDASGQIQRSWVLASDERLLDAGVVGNHMFLLARTDAGEFRLIRMNVDTGSRIESVTWTPEASGSTGPDARGWLVEWNGWSAALEADGTLRIWNPQGGATPLTTSQIEGTGEVVEVGKWKANQYWVSRTQTRFLEADGSVSGIWPAPVRFATEDRTSQAVWILWDNGSESQWVLLESNGFSALGEALQAGPIAGSGSVAHNRPGYP